jgi:hypothetical protein
VRRLKNDGLLIVCLPRSPTGVIIFTACSSALRRQHRVPFGTWGMEATFVTSLGKKVPPASKESRLTDAFSIRFQCRLGHRRLALLLHASSHVSVSCVLMILVLLLLSGWLVRASGNSPDARPARSLLLPWAGLCSSTKDHRTRVVFGNVVSHRVVIISCSWFSRKSMGLWRGPVRQRLLCSGWVVAAGFGVAHLSATGGNSWAKLVMPVALTLPCCSQAHLSSELTERGDIGEISPPEPVGAMVVS